MTHLDRRLPVLATGSPGLAKTVWTVLCAAGRFLVAGEALVAGDYRVLA